MVTQTGSLVRVLKECGEHGENRIYFDSKQLEGLQNFNALQPVALCMLRIDEKEKNERNQTFAQYI